MEQATPIAGPRPRNRRWLWFFLALALLGLLAIGVNLAYNLGEPLTPEKLQAARELWRQKRPADYDLKILAVQAGGQMSNRYDLKVRGGRVVEFRVNGREPEPLLDEQGNRKPAEEQRRREMYDIDGLFDVIEELMDQDRSAGRRTFTRARFNKADGHLQMYQRQVNGRQEQQIHVDLRPAGGES
ncbi:MAG: hypothetical protein ACJ8F7_04720 [Gemmataceae bacterium]